MLILSSQQVSSPSKFVSKTLLAEHPDRAAVSYQGRTFILEEACQSLQTAVLKCREFLDKNALAIVVDHGRDCKATLWSEFVEPVFDPASLYSAEPVAHQTR